MARSDAQTAPRSPLLRPLPPAPAARPIYPRFPAGAPVRVAFVGQETYFRITSLTAATDAILPRFVDFRAGADAEQMLASVVAHGPDAVVVFRPEIVPAGLFATLRVPVVGFLTEPLPRGNGDPHPDLQARLAQSLVLDGSNFDRIVSFDPLFVEAAESLVPVWRSVPLPVDDSCFGPVRLSAVPPRVVFVGRSTEHRERYLIPVKHRFDVLHIAHGVHGEQLLELLRSTDVGINLHNEPYPSFENRVCLHLAAGNLVISEPLSPTHGLEPGIDYIEADRPEALDLEVDQLHRFPDLYHRVRIRGRMKAEAFRASRVYPRLLRDLVLDLEVFGTERSFA